MVTIETHAHVGSDGVLRLEVPVPSRDEDVEVVVIVSAQGEPARAEAEPDAWADLRRKLSTGPAAGRLRLPLPGVWNRRRPKPLVIGDGRSASDLLVEERR